MSRRGRVWGIIAFLAAVSCSVPEGYSRFQPIDESGWKQSEVIHFKPQLNDSTSEYDLSLLIRHTDTYRYQDLWLLVALKEGTEVQFDTLHLTLADQYGRWTGAGSGTVRTCRIPYKSRQQFEKEGSCAVSVKQFMNDEKLKGVLNIGLSIEKSKEGQKRTAK